LKVKNPEKSKKETNPFIYLVPELVNLTGLTDEQRSNFRVMKNVGEYTKLTATQRMGAIADMRDRINSDKEILFDIAPEPRALNGYVFDNPEIFLGKSKSIVAKNGNINIRDRILDPHIFKNIVFCYSITPSTRKFDTQESDFAIDRMIEAS
jgi:aubergine-like protein